MSAPSMDEYFSPDFDPSSLKVPQLRSILVEHGVPFGSVVKKSDLIDLFEDNVRPKATKLLAKASTVRASARGIVSVSENGDEAPLEPPKKGRGRPRKTPVIEISPSPEPEHEPPAKRLRARSRRSAETDGDGESLHESIVVTPAPEKKSRGRPKKVKATEDEGVEVGTEDDEQKVPTSTKSRRSTIAKRTPAVTPEPVPALPIASSSRKPRVSTQVKTPAPTPAESEKTPVPRSILKKEPVYELSGAESEADDIPRQTPSKRKATRTPRRSDGEESGFSDVNPFQSGSEDAARKELRRRKSSMGPVLNTPRDDTPRQPRRSEPQAISFTPGQSLRKLGPSQENLRSPPKEIRQQMLQDRELQEAQAHNQVVSTKLNEISTRRDSPPQITITEHVHERTPEQSLVRRTQEKLHIVPSPSRAIPLSALFLALLSWVAQWKQASSDIGFCDTGGGTNDIVLNREAKIDNAQACIARNAALQIDSSTPQTGLVRCDTSSLPLLPFLPRPTACTPCPPHALCSAGNLVSCEPEYILSYHPLSILSTAVDGLPGLEPRVFPPQCKPDTAKKRMIGGLAQEVERYLARGRGKVVCAGLGKEDGRKGDGERYGLEEEVLRETFDARRDPKFSKEQFEEVWEAALRDLVDHEDIIESLDVDGKSWYAAVRTDMTVGCRVKTEAYKSLDAWKAQLGSTAAVLFAILALQKSLKSRREEKFKAEDLAQVVLKRLQDQERLHYTDPASTPHPYLAPAQVRDLVLPHRGSVASRTRLWAKVEALIEKNANVQTREREVVGEIWRTWEWTGVGMIGGSGGD